MNSNALDEGRRRNELGRALFKSGHFGEALLEFKAAIELNPKEPAYHRNLGSVFLKLPTRRYEASEEYRKAVFLAPNGEKAGYLHELGNCLMDLGEIAEAVKTYERAAKLATNTAFETNYRNSLKDARAKANEETRHIELDAAQAEHPSGKRRSAKRRPL